MQMITTWDAWCKVHATLDFWRDEIAAVCETHCIPIRHLADTFQGTHAVFFVNDEIVLKLFCPFRHNSFALELQLHKGPLHHRAMFPRLLFHGVSPGGYDYIAFDRIKGTPVRDAGMERISHSLLRTLAETIATLQADTLDRTDGLSCLIHYDLTRDHVYLDDDGGLAGLIDFGDARTGHPSEEFPVLFVDCLDCEDPLIEAFRGNFNEASNHYQIDERDIALALRSHPFGRDMIAAIGQHRTQFSQRMLELVHTTITAGNEGNEIRRHNHSRTI